MKDCDICPTKIIKRNKKKHEQSKQHKCHYSNLIINKYILRNYENEQLKDIFQSYYDKLKKKLDNFTVWVICKKNDELVYEIKLPSNVVVEKRYRIAVDYVGPLFRIESCDGYLDSLDLDQYFCDEKNIIFISNLKDMTFFHFMKQPKSMLCRKLLGNIVDGNCNGYIYERLPKCFNFNK